MPELPEIEIIKRGLRQKIISKKIDNVSIGWQKSFVGDPKLCQNLIVQNISRRGKLLILELSQEKAILIHLKMTGQLVFMDSHQKNLVVGGHPQASYNQPLPHKHTHITFNFSDKSKLYFNDLRKFGYVKFILKDQIKRDLFVANLGVDALSREFNSNYLIEKIKSKQKISIFGLLLDQKVVAGIGNIYANEALYRAKIRPNHAAKSLTQKQLQIIIQKIKKVLHQSLDLGGSTDSTYRDIEGKKGQFLQIAEVYHKKFDSKGHKIIREKIAGRTAHICPICQK